MNCRQRWLNSPVDEIGDEMIGHGSKGGRSRKNPMGVHIPQP